MSFDSQFARKSHTEADAPLKQRCAWVKCAGYRCLAFLDKDRKWRGFYDGKELPEPVDVLQYL